MPKLKSVIYPRMWGDGGLIGLVVVGAWTNPPYGFGGFNWVGGFGGGALRSDPTVLVGLIGLVVVVVVNRHSYGFGALVTSGMV